MTVREQLKTQIADHLDDIDNFHRAKRRGAYITLIVWLIVGVSFAAGEFVPQLMGTYWQLIKLLLVVVVVTAGVVFWRKIRTASIWLDDFRCPGCHVELGHLVAGRANLSREQALTAMDEISVCPGCNVDFDTSI